jgi:hypothetical protein
MATVSDPLGAGAAPSRRAVRDRLQATIARLDASGESPDVRIALAEACFRLAVEPGVDIEESIELLRKAERHDPFHPKLPFHLGRLRHLNGDPQGAVFEYRRALNLAPRSHRTCVHLALALQQLSDEERNLALDMLRALAEGDDHRLHDVTVRLDQVIDRQLNRGKEARGGRQTAPAAPPDEGAPTGRSRWKGLWKLALLQELARPRAQKKKVGQLLDQGKALIEADRGAPEYALACLFLALESPASCRAVDGMLRESRLAAHANRPAVRLVAAACELGQAGGAEAFVEIATAKMHASELPAELVCCLHYTWYGTDSTIDAVRAASLVDRYPEEVRSLQCFKEMRVAILDHHAREAWGADRLDRAEILWQAAVALDPFRIAVAHNLALVATRAKSREKYDLAWERATELRYLLAAAAADLRLEVDDRVKLHRSFAQQCQVRYAAKPASRGADKVAFDAGALMADPEALGTWLREWDLYYLNSRIRFHSIVHLLGVSRDCTGEDADMGRQHLLLQFAVCCQSRRWAGMLVFLSMVDELATRAVEEIKDTITRKRDPYYEIERADADKLAGEAIERGFLLLKMLKSAIDAGSPSMRLAGYQVTRSLLTLPWRSLEPACKKAGTIAGDVDMIGVFLSHFLGLVLKDVEGDAVPAHVDAKLAVFQDCLRALPDAVDLRLSQCRFLLQARRHRQAYDAALEALPLTEKMADRDDAAALQRQLVICIDNAALEQLAPDLLRPRSREALTSLLAEGRRILQEFPRAAGLRQILARYLIQLGEEEVGKLTEAAALLEQGLELVLSDEQLRDLRELLEKAGSRSRAVEAVARIRSLLGSASTRAREAVEIVRAERSPATVRQAGELVEEAIHEAQQAEEAATEVSLAVWAGKARQLAGDLRQIMADFEKG